MNLILTCEHGGNIIPPAYTQYFHTAPLNTHRAYDLGALDLFFKLKPLSQFSVYSTTSRLLVELNRSLDNKELFSEYTNSLPEDIKREILDQFYFPYRNEVEDHIRKYIESGEKVVHVSVHSFTTILNGDLRRADMGLLFDPDRQEERLFCNDWAHHMYNVLPDTFVQMNYPYKGTDDGFTTYLRKIFPQNYLGIELEANQKWSNENIFNVKLAYLLYHSLEKMLQEFPDTILEI